MKLKRFKNRSGIILEIHNFAIAIKKYNDKAKKHYWKVNNKHHKGCFVVIFNIGIGVGWNKKE